MNDLRPMMTLDDLVPLLRISKEGLAHRIRRGLLPIRPKLTGKGGKLLFAPGDVERLLAGELEDATPKSQRPKKAAKK